MADKFSGSKNGFGNRTIIDMLEQPPTRYAIVGFPDLNSSGSSSDTSLALNGNDDFSDELGKHTVTGMNNVTFVSGKFDKAFSFNGSDSKFEVADEGEFSFNTTEWTIDFWLNFNGFTDGAGIISKAENNGANNSTFLLYGASNGFSFLLGTGSSWYTSVSSGTLSLNTWYHIALVRHSDVVTCYVDGTSVGTIDVSSGVGAGSHNLVFGTWPSNNTHFSGTIDSFHIANEALWTSNFTVPSTENIIAPTHVYAVGNDDTSAKGKITQLDYAGNQIWNNAAPTQPLYGVDIDDDGNAYTCSQDQRIYIFDKNGVKTIDFQIGIYPRNIAYNPKYNVMGVVGTSDDFKIYNPSGGYIEGVGIGDPTDIAVYDGYFYVGSNHSPQYIKKYTWNGYWQQDSPDLGGNPKCLAFDSDGNIYVGIVRRIRKINSDNTLGWLTGEDVPSTIYDIYVDSSGNIYACSGVSGTSTGVAKYNSSGTLQWMFTGHTKAITGITVDSNGNVYTASDDNTVRKIDSSGNQVWSYNFNDTARDVMVTLNTDMAPGFVTTDSNNISLSGKSIITKARYNADISWQGSIKMLVSFDHRNTWNYWDGDGWVDSDGVDYSNAKSIETTMAALEMSRLEAGDTYLDFAIKGAEGGYGDPALNRIDIEVR